MSSDATLDEEIILPEAAYARAKAGSTTRQCLIGAGRRATGGADHAAPLSLRPLQRQSRSPRRRTPDLVTVQWDLVTGDPDPHVSAKDIANSILTKAHPGAIIVAHANGRGHNTAEALALALPEAEGSKAIASSR